MEAAREAQAESVRREVAANVEIRRLAEEARRRTDADERAERDAYAELRREQDESFEASLATDRAAAEAEAAAAETAASAAAAAAAAAADAERVLREAEVERATAAAAWAAVPEPPPGTDGAVHLAFSYSDGSRVRRRFPASTTLSEVLGFGLASASFSALPAGARVAVSTALPTRRVFTLDSPVAVDTLAQCGLSSGENLMVSPQSQPQLQSPSLMAAD